MASISVALWGYAAYQLDGVATEELARPYIQRPHLQVTSHRSTAAAEADVRCRTPSVAATLNPELDTLDSTVSL